MDGQPTWTDCGEAGDYVVPNVLSPRDLVFRPDNMDETVPLMCFRDLFFYRRQRIYKVYFTDLMVKMIRHVILMHYIHILVSSIVY